MKSGYMGIGIHLYNLLCTFFRHIDCDRLNPNFLHIDFCINLLHQNISVPLFIVIKSIETEQIPSIACKNKFVDRLTTGTIHDTSPIAFLVSINCHLSSFHSLIVISGMIDTFSIDGYQIKALLADRTALILTDITSCRGRKDHHMTTRTRKISIFPQNENNLTKLNWIYLSKQKTQILFQRIFNSKIQREPPFIGEKYDSNNN